MNERVRILLADDDVTALMLMTAALEAADFTAINAQDGERTLALFAQTPCEMVLLDVDMPGMDGFETCKRLRQLAGDELPIVMVTGLDDTESIARAFEAGATDFISKPIHWNLIGHRIKYLWRAHLTRLDLHRANARNAAILSALPDTLLRLADDGTVLDRLAGHNDQAHPRTGSRLQDTLPEAISQAYMDAITEARSAGQIQDIEYSLQQVDGPVRYFETRLVIIDHQETLCLIRDITQRKEADQEIHRLAYYDTLTGLANRQHLMDRLEGEIRRARSSCTQLGVLFLDLDGFKQINDTLGHAIGDVLLQHASQRLRLGVRPTDTVSRPMIQHPGISLARLGGDEFTVIIPDMNHPEDALIAAQRIQELMRQPFFIAEREMVITASIGIAIFPDDGEDADTLLKHADTAMYHAKYLGRNNTQFYSPTLTQEAMRRLNMESDLRRALNSQEFFLVYQPQVDLQTGHIRSVEALIRWVHPQHGLIPPAEFIPLAEDNGLIISIGDWVLRTACRDAARWHAAGFSLEMAVNLSPVQFRNGTLTRKVRDILEETGLDARFLELEITETTLMDESATTLQTLCELQELGVKFSLDDFGTGYSSMSYLRRLPLHNLKVDRSFVSGLPHDAGSLAIIRAIVSLSESMGFTVTAEGVENLEQVKILIQQSCHTLQGYYFSKPVPSDQLPALLGQNWDFDRLP
ncbi:MULTISPECIES: bifunctional diguanylate cyclase/phosphodiesterase [unclassified Ectothiorhodospira]|uniref:putative bifunctional diguanylate cyclase/phosphodiesterase n=1 Tax=unclassified Ectothiorhodospira TaxID=2684909 RepID=UPI001EE8BFB2|nr:MULTISPECIES: EAL domain-containing protein [unclassified Ectothiorhodospira]MCG5515533.1 EAL domain-containing protein [Ectothiorhodospira sp. 9100]MCG5518692.1 EAL domain-containing protein [Ectothiorhodospira sp. 9905]